MHLIEILLPVSVQPSSETVVSNLVARLTNTFGGITTFTRSPGEGRWKDGQQVVKDDVLVLEIMTEAIDYAWWHALRAELEAQLEQDEIVIRAHQIERL